MAARKNKKKPEGRPREAVEGLVRALQEDQPKGRSLPGKKQPGRIELLKPERANQNF